MTRFLSFSYSMASETQRFHIEFWMKKKNVCTLNRIESPGIEIDALSDTCMHSTTRYKAPEIGPTKAIT